MVIADTGFWLALANRRDRFHEPARAALQDVREPLTTTMAVLTETCHLLSHRLGSNAAVTFMESVSAGACHVQPLASADLPRVVELMRKYSDLPMGLADASLVLLAARSGDGRILSTDQRDFQTYRWKNTEPFTNLLLAYIGD